MPKKLRKKKIPKKYAAAGKKAPRPKATEEDLTRLEFHRHALALLPKPEDNDPGVAVMVLQTGSAADSLFCNCTKSRSTACSHVRKLSAAYRFMQSMLGHKTPEQDFRDSIWYRLAEILTEGCAATPQTVASKLVSENGQEVLTVYDSRSTGLLTYISAGSDRARFEGRCLNPQQNQKIPSRAAVLAELAFRTLSENERTMAARGFKSRLQALEEKFWYLTAYHAYRECGAHKIILDTTIADQGGDFYLNVLNWQFTPVFRIRVPRSRVKALTEGLKNFEPQYQGLKIHPIALISLLKISQTPDQEFEITPLIQLTLQNGQTRLWEEALLQTYRYGELYYISDPGILGEHRQPRRLPPALLGPEKKLIKKEDIPAFLAEFGEDFAKGPFLPDTSVAALNIFKRPDQINITPRILERDWCWLSVTYGFGNAGLSLAEILQAKAEGRRFIETPGGWVDALSPALEGLEILLDPSAGRKSGGPKDRVKLSRLDLLRLRATAAYALKVEGPKSLADRVSRLLDFKPAAPLPKIRGMNSMLRTYQQRGVEWISFLYENGFGGLLCDDMGLGKTHEVMAFMLFLRKHRKIKKPFLVVCPTTVLSHWADKIRDHAPGLKAATYHGGLRNLNEALGSGDVLLTSYGILRRDIRALKKRAFGLAVFDEIQYIKNHLTQAYDAAAQIRARMKLGLTGTPIENSLFELKNLMDLVLSGYLGSDEAFKSRYVKSIEENFKSPRRRELSRLISPFTLRRQKATVLSELPPKIEDIRTCRLSEDQIKLYRDAVASRGHQLIQQLKKSKSRIPYIHIFALLTLLKQICNHPASVEKSRLDYDQYQSGKWELFKELLAESLDSGQKVVVYSQYLNMIRITETHLTQSKVDFVSLTGASRKRGQIIARFNNDPACRVFVGSLKAGGTGIDLVAASVVIHYDRWWNAAREDQATDRVHRIGQQRGVQVFKLVTEGTLEEKISAIITKKRSLMNGVIQEDDPGLLKTFSRGQLMELLSAPVY